MVNFDKRNLFERAARPVCVFVRLDLGEKCASSTPAQLIRLFPIYLKGPWPLCKPRYFIRIDTYNDEIITLYSITGLKL